MFLPKCDIVGPGGYDVNDNDLSNADVETDSEDVGLKEKVGFESSAQLLHGIFLDLLNIDFAGCAFWKT